MKRSMALLGAVLIGAIISPVALYAAAKLTGQELLIKRSVDTAFRLWAREGVETFPVATFQPVKNNTVMTLDVIPKGTPPERVGAGFAWIDVCDRDTQINPNVVCMRAAARSGAMEIASKATGTAAAKPLWISMGGTPAIIVGTDGGVTIPDLRASSAASSCTTSNAGALRFDHPTRTFLGCSGTGWVALSR